MSGLFDSFQAPQGYRQAIDMRWRSPDEGPESNWYKFDPNAPDYDFSQGLPNFGQDDTSFVYRPGNAQNPMPGMGPAPDYDFSQGLPGLNQQQGSRPDTFQGPSAFRPGVTAEEVRAAFAKLNQPGNPGYQQPQPGQQPQQDNQQYYQQVVQNFDGLSEAFKQIEKMQMPGVQGQGGIGNYLMGSGGK